MQKFLEYNLIVRKPIVPQIGRVLLLLITETQYAKNNQEFCTGDQNQFPHLKKICKTPHEELSSSEHKADPEVSFHPHQPLQPSKSQVRQPQPAVGMYMPYIEGPCMDWTVNDGLYHRFLKCHLKCKNILEFELAALLECQQCKKGNCLEWRLWDGSVCVMEPIFR